VTVVTVESMVTVVVSALATVTVALEPAEGLEPPTD